MTLNLRNEITLGGNDTSQVRELFSEAKLIPQMKKVGGGYELDGR